MKKKLTLQQQIRKLEQSIAKFGDAHHTKEPILEELKRHLKQTVDNSNTL